VFCVRQVLLAYYEFPNTGKSHENILLRSGIAQFELNGVGVAHVNFFYCGIGKQGCAWAAKALGRKNDALIRRFDILGGKITTVVKLHALAQEKRVGFGILRDLPTMSQVRNDSLTTVPRVTPD